MKHPLLLAAMGLVGGAVAGLATAPAPPVPAVAAPALPAGAVASAPALPTRTPGLPASLVQEERERPLAGKLAALHHPVRQRQLPPEVVLAELGVQPGMTVVDIGAGGGHLSVPMARALDGRGRVFATDVDDRLVPLLRQRAEREGLAALSAVLVGPDFDPFYRGKQFDLAVLCSVFEYLRAPSDFFRQLRPSLRAGSGRLAILQGRTAATYFPTDFGAAFRRQALVAAGDRSPVWRRLRPDVRGRLAALASAAAPDPGLAADVAADFDRMLDDPGLLVELATAADRAGAAARLFADHGADDRVVVRWILHHFDDGGLWDVPAALRGLDARALPPPAVERGAVRTLNWTALLPWFRDSLPREIFPRGIYLTPQGIARRLEAEGYRLVRSVDVLPAHDFLIFAPDPGQP